MSTTKRAADQRRLTASAASGKESLTPRPKRQRGVGKKTKLAARQQLVVVKVPQIPLATLQHVRNELARIYREARCGLLDPSDLTKFSFSLGELRKLIVDMDLEARIAALENNHGR